LLIRLGATGLEHSCCGKACCGAGRKERTWIAPRELLRIGHELARVLLLDAVGETLDVLSALLQDRLQPIRRIRIKSVHGLL
jgi:hypothetical protein